jgi:hypothetical protein
VLLYLRQMVIAAVWLDAFFVATSFVLIFITVFGDIFDSAGIPPNVAIGVAIATTAAWFLPEAPTAWLDVGATGLLFAACYMAFLLFNPGDELRGSTESCSIFPFLHRRFRGVDDMGTVIKVASSFALSGGTEGCFECSATWTGPFLPVLISSRRKGFWRMFARRSILDCGRGPEGGSGGRSPASLRRNDRRPMGFLWYANGFAVLGGTVGARPVHPLRAVDVQVPGRVPEKRCRLAIRFYIGPANSFGQLRCPRCNSPTFRFPRNGLHHQ